MSALLSVIRSLIFYPVFYLGSLFFVVGTVLASALPGRVLEYPVHGWSRYHRLCARWILGIRLVVEGEVPSAPVLVAMKHESFFEAIDMPTLLDRPGVFTKAELMDLPLWGRAALAYGLVRVEREAGAKALRAMRTAALVLVGQGRPLAIFPEGTRTPHGSAPPLQSGFAGLYKLIGVPVVAAATDSGRLYHRLWKRPGIITVRFFEAIPPGLPRDEVEALVRVQINALNGAE